MIFDPRGDEGQLLSQLIEQIVEERAVFVFAVHDQRRRLPLETLPDRFDWIEMRRSNWKENEIDSKHDPPGVSA